jgi:hypothetical protein
VLVFAPEKGMKSCLSYAVGKKRKGPLDDAIKLAGRKNHLVVGVNASALAARFKPLLAATPQAKLLQPVNDAQSATLVLNLKEGLELETQVKLPSKDKAAEFKKMTDDLLAVARFGLPNAKPMLGPDMYPTVEKALESVKVESKGTEVSIKAQMDASGLASAIAMLPQLMAGAGPGRSVCRGTVTYRGRPLSTGTVLFVGSGGKRATGLIFADGSYQIVNPPGGEVKVAIHWVGRQESHWLDLRRRVLPDRQPSGG